MKFLDIRAGDARARHAAPSVLRERIVEHIFVGEAMRRLWQLGVLNVEILRVEFDASGYDLVMCGGSVIRHVQFKVSLVDGARAQVVINQGLAHARSWCVVWLGVTEISKSPSTVGSARSRVVRYPTSPITRQRVKCVPMHKASRRNERISEFSGKASSRGSPIWTRRYTACLDDFKPAVGFLPARRSNADAHEIARRDSRGFDARWPTAVHADNC
ncbi:MULTISPECIES: hypothetical protein [Burkholderia]|uniref:hypothetical protein n=1 Tax=Burkholderia TaxID=32008 RepID=UPI001FC8C606|nr:hypothetical protein [Burkholderia seminalis]